MRGTRRLICASRSRSWISSRSIRFRILAGDHVQKDLIPATLELNQPLEYFFTFSPPTPITDDTRPFLRIEPATVILGALKKADHEDALIVRLVESAGEAITAQISLEGGAAQEIAFRPFEIKTFKVSKTGIWAASDLLES